MPPLAEKVSALIGEVPCVVKTWSGCVGRVGAVAMSTPAKVQKASDSNGNGPLTLRKGRLLLVGHMKHL